MIEQIEYYFSVPLANMCQGIQFNYKLDGKNRFKGILLYSVINQEAYFTIDTVTYTPAHVAYDVCAVNPKHIWAEDGLWSYKYIPEFKEE